MENWTISNAVCQNPRSQKKFFDKSIEDGEPAKPKKEKKEEKDRKDKPESVAKKPKSKKEKKRKQLTIRESVLPSLARKSQRLSSDDIWYMFQVSKGSVLLSNLHVLQNLIYSNATQNEHLYGSAFHIFLSYLQ